MFPFKEQRLSFLAHQIQLLRQSQMKIFDELAVIEQSIRNCEDQISLVHLMDRL